MSPSKEQLIVEMINAVSQDIRDIRDDVSTINRSVACLDKKVAIMTDRSKRGSMVMASIGSAIAILVAIAIKVWW